MGVEIEDVCMWEGKRKVLRCMHCYILLANFQLGTQLPRQHPYTNMCSLGDIYRHTVKHNCSKRWEDLQRGATLSCVNSYLDIHSLSL